MALTQPPPLLVSPGQGQRKSVWREVSTDPARGPGPSPGAACLPWNLVWRQGAQSTAHRDLLLHSQGTESSVGRWGTRNTCFGAYRDQAREMNAVLPAGTTWSCGGGLGEGLSEMAAGTRGPVATLRSLHRMYHSTLLFQPLRRASRRLPAAGAACGTRVVCPSSGGTGNFSLALIFNFSFSLGHLLNVREGEVRKVNLPSLCGVKCVTSRNQECPVGLGFPAFSSAGFVSPPGGVCSGV